jgi:N-methylhydantoinase A/oxoprolinase/acetone carboxylase beta subunit/N-methylhydantoinase B/oxoprolinase/acetone carboxylase alpha subunit
MAPRFRAGIDTGGTFTDLVVRDDTSGRLRTTKVLSTPGRPAEAILDAFGRADVPLDEVSSIALGTTLATNAVIERSGAHVLFVTTAGFEDVPMIQRIDRGDPYDRHWVKPEPFVRREDAIGVAERTGADGAVVEPLSQAALGDLHGAIAERLERMDDGDEPAIAVSLLFSYANPAHEQRIAAMLAAEFPDVPVSVSHRVAPIWREYERASTVILDAYLRPTTARLVRSVRADLAREGFGGALWIMKSNGGHAAAATIGGRPVDTILSGLSSGLVAAREIARRQGLEYVVTLDIGGTSTDVGFVEGGEIRQAPGYEVEFGIPVSGAAVDVVTLGAGGGSIAWVDAGGLLHVGPHSAGADPGPACYARGGTSTTVTDANVVLGRLAAEDFAGSELEIDEAAAEAALGRLGGRLGLTAPQAAAAVVEVATENIANAMRRATAERGIDPRDCTLLAFGGGGPLHGAEIGAALGVREVVVPPHPSVASAFGALCAEHRVERRWTDLMRSTELDAAALGERFRARTEEALAALDRDGFVGTPRVGWQIGMRYAGQNYESQADVEPGELTPATLREAIAGFHARHEEAYGYGFRDQPVELVEFGVVAAGPADPLRLGIRDEQGASEAAGRRAVRLSGEPVAVPVFERSELAAGFRAEGPALVTDVGATLLVPPGHRLDRGRGGYLRIARASSEAGEPSRDAERAVDPVSLTVIDDQLTTIATEMGTHLMRTAYSAIFSESRDFSCALFDRDGRLLAQGPFSPAQLGAVPEVVRYVLEEFPASSLADGDVLLHNDPFRGGCHMPEHSVVRPIFASGELVAFAACIGHMAEIGAMVAGSFASNATEVWQEGLRLPTVKLVERGEDVTDVWRIVLANHRTPRNSWGDLRAMIGSLQFATRRVQELLAKYGQGFSLRVFRELLDYSERTMRARIVTLPDGEYSFEDLMEDDGITAEPHRLHASVTVRGDRLVVDYTGSGPQARGPINATFAVARSAAFNAVLQLFGSGVPRNAGAYRPITVVNPAGRVTNARFPGPTVGGNTETQPKLIDAVLGAFYRALPEEGIAAEGSTACNFLFGGHHPRTGDYFVHYLFEGCGWGATPAHDGCDVQNHVHGNCRNTPVEVFDTRFPFLTLEYGLVPDSGGAGRYRGGLSSRRVIRATGPEITVSALMDRVKSAAWGVEGGGEGGRAAILVKRNGERDFRPFTDVFGTVSPSKFANIAIRAGDEILIQSAGGGGHGDPVARPAETVLADVRAGLVSVEAAERQYKVALRRTDTRLEIDEEATERLRGRAPTPAGAPT